MVALQISPPSQSVDCGNVDFVWQGGTPNYDLKILFPGGVLDFSQVQGTFATWLGNTTEGIQLTLQITDSTGNFRSITFTPEAGSADSSCPTNEFELLYPGTSTGQILTATGSIVGSTPATITSATATTTITSATSASTRPANISTASDSAGSAPLSSSATASPPTSSNSLSDAGGKQDRVGLGTGAIVGITVGATLIIVLVVLVTFLLCKRKKRRNQRRTAQPYSWGSSTLNDSESPSPRNLTSESSPSRFSKRMRERLRSNTVTPVFLPGQSDTVRTAGASMSPVSHTPMQMQNVPAHTKTRHDILPTSVVPAAIPGRAVAERAPGSSTDGSAPFQDSPEATASDVWTADTGRSGRSGRRRMGMRNVRYETDGGVRLAGGRPGEPDDEDDDDDSMSRASQTVTTLPPPYFTLAQT